MDQDLFSFAASFSPEETPQTDILTVSEFLHNLNLTFSEIGLVKIKGEIEDISLRGSYAFFDLKESAGGMAVEACVNCFAGWKVLDKVQHLLQSGMEVVISGNPRIYVKNGKFSIDITNIEPVGEGALQKAFEALKNKLANKGYFDEERKRPIPEFTRHVGLITSMSGAAVIDFKRNLGSYGFTVECIDVRVEGEYAEDSIVKAMKTFNEQRPHLDAIILMRGGGSLESLKAFNSEKIADAIYFSRIPVIVGIGHEKDETIADYVADVRCSTPTAVATFLTSQRDSLMQKMETLISELVYSTDGIFHNANLEVNHAQEGVVRNFEYILQTLETKIVTSETQLQSGLHSIFNLFHSLELKVENAATQIDYKFRLHKQAADLLQQKLMMSFQDLLIHNDTQVENYHKQINSLNPEAILQRGYSIVTDEKGKTVRSIKGAKTEDVLNIRLSDGELKAEVK